MNNKGWDKHVIQELEWLIEKGYTYHFDDEVETINWPDHMTSEDFQRVKDFDQFIWSQRDRWNIWAWMDENEWMWEKYKNA